VAAMQQSEKPAWKKKLEYFQSIELENKGSVARDHLALGMLGSSAWLLCQC
jgi:hypothetical protein